MLQNLSHKLQRRVYITSMLPIKQSNQKSLKPFFLAIGGLHYYGGINKWTPPRKSERIPRGVSTRFSLSVENEQHDDAGRDARTCLTRPNSQA